MISSMIVDDLDLFRSCFSPPEANAELIVDPDGMLAGAITFQRLQVVVRKCSEFAQDCRAFNISSFRRATRTILWEISPRNTAAVVSFLKLRIISQCIIV